MDLYSLFGNALDNAIEAVEHEDEEHRIIVVNAVEQGRLLNIRVENYCSQRLTFQDGLPVSTKAQDGYHGFGTKSIKFLMEKYGGQCSMRQKDDRFILSLLFTLP